MVVTPFAVKTNRNAWRPSSIALMWALIGVTLLSPLADTNPRFGAALGIFILVMLLAASLAESRRIILVTGIPLAGLWLLARLLQELGDSRKPYTHLSHAAGLALSCMILWTLANRLRSTPEVTTSALAEAVTVYLMIAIAFSQLYWILNQLIPLSFRPAIPASDSASLMYFSLTTLTGVGAGSLITVSPFLRLVSAFESMMGVFYIALVVAKLVSAYKSKTNH